MTASTDPTPNSVELVRWLTPVEVAYMLGKNVKTVNGWLRDQNHPLKGHKVGNAWRVHPDDFREFMNQEGRNL